MIRPEQKLSLEAVSRAYNERFAMGGFRESETFYRWILRKLEVNPDTSLLDMSCGEGHLLAAAEQYAGVVSRGIDLSSVALELAQRRAPSSGLARCDGVALPFLSGSFDYVTNLGSLEHYSSPLEGVRQIRRALKPGGQAAILLPNSYYLGDIVWWVLRTGYGPSHKQILERFATRGEWQDLLREGGLEVQRVLPYNFCFPLTMDDWRWYLARPTRFVNLLFSALTPTNLAYGFLFICRRSD